MSGLARRLAQLEEAAQPLTERCGNCRSWPRTRLVGEAYDGPPPAVPECCPGCGWEPLTIRVEYVDMPPAS